MLMYVALGVTLLLVAFAVYWFVIRKNDDDELTDTPVPSDDDDFYTDRVAAVTTGGTRYKVMADGTVRLVSSPDDVETFVSTVNQQDCTTTSDPRAYCDSRLWTEPPLYYLWEDLSDTQVPLNEVRVSEMHGLADALFKGPIPDRFPTIDQSTPPPWCDETHQSGCMTHELKRVVDVYNALFSTDNTYASENIRAMRNHIEQTLPADADLRELIRVDPNTQQVQFDMFEFTRLFGVNWTEEPTDAQRQRFLMTLRLRSVSSDQPANTHGLTLLFLYVVADAPISPIEIDEAFRVEESMRELYTHFLNSGHNVMHHLIAFEQDRT